MKFFKHKSIFSLLLVVAMVVTMLPTAAFAAEVDVSEEHIHTEACTHETDEADPLVTPEAPSETSLEEASEDEASVPEETVSEETTKVVEETVAVATDEFSGTVADSLVEWQFDSSTGMLKISGSGGCETFTSAEDQPWKHLRDQIREVWFYDMDMLSISNLAYWFDGCSALEMAELPYTTFTIGEKAFADCVSLHRVLMYYTETAPVVVSGAFQVDELTPMEVLYIPMAESANDVLHTYDWGAENRAVYFSDVYGMMALASGWCIFCQGTYEYTYECSYWHEGEHIIRHWCSNCGKDQCEGVYGQKHSYDNSGNCTGCGYYNADYDNSVCYHSSTYYSWSGCTYYEYCRSCGEYMGSGVSHGSTYTEWSGCDWYDYCRDCDELMDYGTSHGNYSYGSWEYYNSSRHRRYYSCDDCGEGSYSYGYHSTSTQYSQYSSTQHQKGSYCSTCSSYVGSTSYESHSFTYGSWQNYDGTQHRRTKTCSSCGYSTYEYASHSLTYGAWSSYSGSQHRRTASCSCGYSSYEYASHSFSTGSWTSTSDSQHSRVKSCSCGYSTTESENHSFTYGAWSSVSDESHTRTKSCSCGYTGSETAPHEYVSGTWQSYDEEQHRRSNTCSCGHSVTEYESHDDADSDDYCDSCSYLMSRFSVTVPANLSLTVSKNGDVYSATSAQIANNSTAAVKVSSIEISTVNGWSLVPYATNMANAKVDAKFIGFKLNGAVSTATGNSENLTLNSDWIIAKGDALTLDYDAVVSATSDPISEQVITIVFVLRWAE